MRTIITTLLSFILITDINAQNVNSTTSSNMDFNIISLKIKNKSTLDMVVLDKIKLSKNFSNMVSELTKIRTEEKLGFKTFANTSNLQTTNRELIFANVIQSRGDELNTGIHALQTANIVNPTKLIVNENENNKENKQINHINNAREYVHTKSNRVSNHITDPAKFNENLNDKNSKDINSPKIKTEYTKSNHYSMTHNSEMQDKTGMFNGLNDEILEIPTLENGFPGMDIFEKELNSSMNSTEEFYTFNFETFLLAPYTSDQYVEELGCTFLDKFEVEKNAANSHKSFASFISTLIDETDSNCEIALNEETKEIEYDASNQSIFNKTDNENIDNYPFLIK